MIENSVHRPNKREMRPNGKRSHLRSKRVYYDVFEDVVVWAEVALLVGVSVVIAAGLSQRVSRLETRLERLLRHVGFDPDPNPPASEDVAVLARTPGGKIAAIKAYRKQTGAGLREAKAEVERLMEKGG